MTVNLGKRTDSLSRRLDSIEGRGPAHNPGRFDSNWDKQTGPPPLDLIQSNNLDFAEMSKVLYLMVQLHRHE
jgi:hypothetical protein